MKETDSLDIWTALSWFGPSWGAYVCDPKRHVATPVGALCCNCPKLFVEGDQGLLIYAPGILVDGLPDERIAYHLDCFMSTLSTLGIGKAVEE